MSSDRILITLVGGAEDGKVFEFARAPVTIGCQVDNDVRLPVNNGSAGHHARIVQEGDLYFVEDIGCQGKEGNEGTYVGGTKVRGKAGLTPGDSILLGRAVVKFDAKRSGGIQEVNVDKNERARMYAEYLRREGFIPEIDPDGDVTFKQEGNLYLIIIDEKDESFFRIVFPNFWPIEDQEERRRVESAAVRATGDTKVAKVFVVRDNVWASVELFCSPPEGFKFVFKRSLGALRTSVGKFVETMRS